MIAGWEEELIGSPALVPLGHDRVVAVGHLGRQAGQEQVPRHRAQRVGHRSLPIRLAATTRAASRSRMLREVSVQAGASPRTAATHRAASAASPASTKMLPASSCRPCQWNSWYHGSSPRGEVGRGPVPEQPGRGQPGLGQIPELRPGAEHQHQARRRPPTTPARTAPRARAPRWASSAMPGATQTQW